jgi:hypothetical protein
MGYSVSQLDLAIASEHKKLTVEGKSKTHAAHIYLSAWGAYRNNEAEREAGLKPPITSSVRSGDALEVDPIIPHEVLTDEEIEQVGEIVVLLSDYHRWCIKQRYVNKNERLTKSRRFKYHLSEALRTFCEYL